MRKLVLALAAVSMIGLSPMTASAAQTTVAAALADPGRSADNVKLDEGRKPAEVLAFLGLKPGMHALDLFGANHYWAEIISPVVGPKGSETIWEPTQFYSDKAKAEFAPYAAKHPMVKLIESPLEAPDFGTNRYDFAIFNLNYHDLYVDFSKRGVPQFEPKEWAKSLYAAMKPGGVLGVIDHAANPSDDTRATANTLHRIDPNVVKADFESAGFVLDASSDVLKNPADDHTLKVFDPKVRGNTDRFVLKFRKPA